MIVLNVGGGNRSLPAKYNGWEQCLLDIDENTKPDICCDAVELEKNCKAGVYDAVYSSHCIEHFYKHDIQKVLKGFYYTLNDDGYAEIHVPNLDAVFSAMRAGNLCLDDTYYRLENGVPVTFHDVIYGWNIAMSNGNLFYAHRCGFTHVILNTALQTSGFKSIWIASTGADLHAIAYKKEGVPCPQ